MENIREVFSGKNFDDKTLFYLDNFIEEFDDLFGKYFPRERVIEQIKANLEKSIEWKNEEKMNKNLGLYYHKERSISLLDSMNEEKTKSVFFHEMMHCLLKYREHTGMIKEYDIDEVGDRKIYIGMGLTEGIAQYLTSIRDAKYSKQPVKSYPILTQQTENLVDLIGKEEFFSRVFEDPDVLEEFLESSDINVDFLLESFDTIWKNEKDLFLSTMYGKEDTLENAIFGGTRKYIKNKRAIDSAAKDIIDTLSSLLMSRDIATVEEFEEVFNTVTKYSKQLNLENNHSNYEGLIERIDDITESLQISREEFLERLPENSDVKNAMYAQFYFDKFHDLTPEQKLHEVTKIHQSDSEIGMAIYDNLFTEYFKAEMAEEVFENHLIDSDREFYRLVEGFSEIALEKGYDPRALAMENISFGRECDDIKDVFELYVTLEDKKIHVGTFMHDMEDNGETSEMLQLTGEKKEEILANNPDIDRNSEILTDSKGDILVHNQDGTYALIDEYGEEYQSEGIEYQMSTTESLEKSIARKKAYLQEAQQISAYPKFILDSNRKRIEELESKRNEILQGAKAMLEPTMEISTRKNHEDLDDFER